MKLKGHIAAAYTPLNSDFSLNLELIKDYSTFLKRNKVNGVFLNGSTSDFTSLTVEERKKITLSWSKQKSNDLSIIDHVGHTSLKVAKDLAAYSADKVDAISAVAPFYFKISDLDKLLTYCKEIAASAPLLPFYYYHIPVLSGANLKMSDFLKIASSEIPNLAGIKFSENNLIDFRSCKAYKDEKYDLLFGFDEMFVDSLLLGAEGWVGSTYNHLMPLYQKIREHFNRGEFKQANNFQSKAIKFVELLDGEGGFNGAGKSFLRYLGINCGPSRFPHNTLSDDVIRKIASKFEELGILEMCNK